MAFPYLFHSNFETGDNSEWGVTPETDTGSLLDIAHYSTISTDPNSVVPWKGAYVLRNALGDTNDHTLTSTSITVADGTTTFFRWYMALSRDFRFTADDTFNVFELQQAGGTVETSIGFRVTNSTQLIEFGVGDGTAPTSFVHWPQKGKMVCVELEYKCSTGGAGTAKLYLDGTLCVSQTSQTHAAAIGKGVLGSQDTVATTLGTIYYDEFIQDDTRLYPYREQYPFSKEILKTGHQFVGPGFIESAVLYTISSGDESLILYDTDTGNTNDRSPLVELSATAQTSVGGPLSFERGCYAVLSGTNPRGAIQMTRSNEKLGVKGPLFYSNWGVRYYGQLRKPRTINV